MIQIVLSFTVTWRVVFIVKRYVKRMSNFQPFVLLCRYYRPQLKVTFSLHTRSVWETICDALPHSSYQNLWFKILWVPPLKYLRNVVSGVTASPSPLPPSKWKFGQDSALWSGVTPVTPPAPHKDLCWSWCVETNRCIPEGYRLVSEASVCSRWEGDVWCHFLSGCLVPCSFQGKCALPLGWSAHPHLVLTSCCGYCSGRYASYWNAFLSYRIFCHRCMKIVIDWNNSTSRMQRHCQVSSICGSHVQ